MTVNIQNSKGLMFEEPLLIEKSRKGALGIDLPKPKNLKLRTGQEARSDVGLPSVSEPEVVRHFVRLSQKNYSIDSGFYPLGSCTMKHNPRLNEKVARLPGLANIHPLQDQSTVQGALEMASDLEDWLSKLTGLPAVTLNPAAGAHGEFAGMLVIHKAHIDQGNSHKNIVLVPDGAHGTNPATAAMCGYKIKSIASTKEGFVDLKEFEEALTDEVAAFMLTNPNTCGLFDPNVKKIADMLHEKGAYFYCDGANFNAIVGGIRPADFGVDVMHINLHKTFSTPHGGGGPGSGPIAVTKELEPFLPVPTIENKDGKYSIRFENEKSIGRVRAYQGHFGMIVRALSYMMAHGIDGLKQASEDAVLSANYIMSQLKDYYSVPYKTSYCMHECLLTDKRQKTKGVAAMDIAKTLIENGIHPMTVYFPLVVQGAMLIEPTESESKDSIDNFISIMQKIAKDVEDGNIEHMHENPVSTPRKRIDEVGAARNPVLTWNEL